MGPYQIFYALTGILLVALPICNCLQALLPQSPLLEPLRGPDDADNLPANNSRPKEIRAANPSSPTYLLEAPRNLTLLKSGIDPNGKAYLQIAWLPPLSIYLFTEDASTLTGKQVFSSSSPQTDHRPLERVDRYRITWREDVQASEEYRKTIDGNSSGIWIPTNLDQATAVKNEWIVQDLTSYTIENLPTSSQFQLDVQAFRWIEDKKVRSLKTSLSARTALRKPPSEPQSDSGGPVSNNSLLSSRDNNITINSIFYQNGLLKSNISWCHSSPKSTGTTFTIRWYPKVCLGWERRFPKDRPLIKPLVGTTVVQNFLVYDLDFNCRYAVAIYQRKAEIPAEEVLMAVRHFMTPLCQDAVVVGSVHPHCPKLASKTPSEPRNLSCIFLVQASEIGATCSWEAPVTTDQPVVGYRAIFAKKLVDPRGLYGIRPFPVLDRNSYMVKVLEEDELSLSIANLEEEAEHVLHVQAVSAAGFGAMARLEFVSPRIMHSLALSQTGHRRDSPDVPLSRFSNGSSLRVPPCFVKFVLLSCAEIVVFRMVFRFL